MGKFDKRRSMKMRRKKGQRRKKARERSQREEWMTAQASREPTEGQAPRVVRVKAERVSEEKGTSAPTVPSETGETQEGNEPGSGEE